MKTKILKINSGFEESELEEAAEILKNGGLVAFPTETVYGLGGNALDANASHKIYEAKGRPSDNPLIVHISQHEDIEKIAYDIPNKVYHLIRVFWPGPLTIILKKKENVPYETTGGLETVAIRLPDNKIARQLIEKSGTFVAAPSANTSGRPSPTRAEHVIEDLSGKINVIIDGGEATLGLESTIIDFTEEIPMILRPGFVTKEQIEDIIGEVRIDAAILSKISDDLKPKAPGMKYKHYAPRGELTIYEGTQEKVVQKINQVAYEEIIKGKKVGVISTIESQKQYNYGIIKVIGSRSDENSIAAGLYKILREFDNTEVDIILTESFSDNKLGQAIMNRLMKAAGYSIIKV